jgi:hypothetical protein
MDLDIDQINTFKTIHMNVKQHYGFNFLWTASYYQLKTKESIQLEDD